MIDTANFKKLLMEQYTKVLEQSVDAYLKAFGSILNSLSVEDEEHVNEKIAFVNDIVSKGAQNIIASLNKQTEIVENYMSTHSKEEIKADFEKFKESLNVK